MFTSRSLSIVLVAAFLATVGVLGAADRPVQAAADDTGYSIDLYFRAGYERQVNGRTCVAASTAMMTNFVARRDVGLGQRKVLRYAQERDALNDRTQRGSDPLGWARAATHYSARSGKASTYVWETHPTRYSGLKRAAYLLAMTRKPVGLLVWNGRHAVVMTGFRATADPRKGAFRLTAVWISDPYGYAHKLYSVDGAPLNVYRETDARARYTRAWYGNFVIVAPVLPPAPDPTPDPDPTTDPDPTPDPAPDPTPDPSDEPEAAPQP